jgi:hypothetical protein
MGRLLRGRRFARLIAPLAQCSRHPRIKAVRRRPYQLASLHIEPKANPAFSQENNMTKNFERPRGAMSVADFALWAGIGRTTAWKEIRDGHLRAVKVSARTIIRFADADSWLATRPSLAVQSAQLSHISK